jgi:hypothetical protein
LQTTNAPYPDLSLLKIHGTSCQKIDGITGRQLHYGTTDRGGLSFRRILIVQQTPPERFKVCHRLRFAS